jgi:hypothetical protein
VPTSSAGPSSTAFVDAAAWFPSASPPHTAWIGETANHPILDTSPDQAALASNHADNDFLGGSTDNTQPFWVAYRDILWNDREGLFANEALPFSEPSGLLHEGNRS